MEHPFKVVKPPETSRLDALAEAFALHIKDSEPDPDADALYEFMAETSASVAAIRAELAKTNRKIESSTRRILRAIKAK